MPFYASQVLFFTFFHNACNRVFKTAIILLMKHLDCKSTAVVAISSNFLLVCNLLICFLRNPQLSTEI